MFISVNYGYKQSSVYNIDCQVAPLLDSIHKQAHSDSLSLLNSRLAFFKKETETINKNIAFKTKKLTQLEDNGEEEKQDKSFASRKSRNKSRQSKAEEEARIEEAKIEQAKAEEAKRQAEKAKETKQKRGKKPKQEPERNLSPEELKQQQVEQEKEEIRKQIAEFSSVKEKIEDKINKIESYKEKFQEAPEEIDLVDYTGNRKNLKTRLEEDASSVLNTKTNYQLVVVDTEGWNPWEIDGYCIRTLEEDSNHQETPEPKFKKSPGKGKKK